MKLVKARMVMNKTVVFIFVYIIFMRILKYESTRFLTHRSIRFYFKSEIFYFLFIFINFN
jgi:hypothetical protein